MKQQKRDSENDIHSKESMGISHDMASAGGHTWPFFEMQVPG